jgi:hypothetical protein
MKGKALLIPLVVISLFASSGTEADYQNPYAAPNVSPLDEETVSFVAVGDFGIGNEYEAAVAAAMKAWVGQHAIDGFLSAGDNVYPEAEQKYFDAAWTEPFGWVDEAGIPVLPALGNHDVEDGSSDDVMDFFDMPGPWYQKTIGNVRVIVLDSNQVDDPDQTRWLEKVITKERTRWTIVVVHKPPYACGRYDGTPAVREAWAPLFARRADLVLSGHDHNYQRFTRLKGVTYVITGGGGDSFYELDDQCTAETPARVAGNDTKHHFLAIRASDTKLEVLAIAADGSIIDRFKLQASQARCRRPTASIFGGLALPTTDEGCTRVARDVVSH